ncbi:autotransporter outer membrane beta-barrel domain-containing protein [Salinarimonas sp.]|uniref:autotransporter outer membrane beta-barrel domain-containing protein n=1 Tax=Salinarimonas sp. TaxID=2766526 RepID=UPI0032D90E96
MRTATFGVAAGLAFALLASGAAAQQPPPQPPPPTPPPTPQPLQPILTDGQRAAILRAGQRHVLLAYGQLTHAIVRQRLSPFGAPATPVAAGGAPAAAYASLDAAAAIPLWNAWVGPSATWSERDHPVFGYDGTQIAGSVGVDRRIGDATVLGAFGLYEDSDFDTVGSGALRGRLGGAGVYVGGALTDILVYDALAIWQGGESTLRDATARGTYDTERWALAGNLTAYLTAGAFQISPTVGIGWVSDRQSAYRDTAGVLYPGLTVETTTVRAGAEIARTFQAAGAATLTPFASATALWDVSRDESPTPATPTDDLPRLDYALSVGLRAAPTPATSLSLEVEASALGRAGYSVITVSGQLGFRF